MATFKMLRGLSSNLPSALNDGYVYFTTDTGKIYIDSILQNKLQRTLINSDYIKSASSDEWDAQSDLISQKNVFYVYRDDDNLTGIKIGDGRAYLIDLPWIDNDVRQHIVNKDIHLTSDERAKWNTAITCAIDTNEKQNLIFTLVK